MRLDCDEDPAAPRCTSETVVLSGGHGPFALVITYSHGLFGPANNMVPVTTQSGGHKAANSFTDVELGFDQFVAARTN